MIGMGVCSCNMNKNSEPAKKPTEEIQLTDRQKEILESVGLSTNVEDLRFYQKDAIMAIEEMLSYLENKYNKSFEYAGYVPKGNLDREALTARASDGLTDYFEVRRTEDGFEDDYMLVFIKDDFSAYVQELVSQIEGIESVKVIAEIGSTELDRIPDNKTEYNGNVRSWNVIFIYVNDTDSQLVTDYVSLIEKSLRENNLYSTDRIVFMKEDIVAEIMEIDFSDYFDKDYCFADEMIYVKNEEN